jgi:hypothetical protein
MEKRSIIKVMRVLSYLIIIPSFITGVAILVVSSTDLGEPFTEYFELGSFSKYMLRIVASQLVLHSIVLYFIFLKNDRWWLTQVELNDAIYYHDCKAKECISREQELSDAILDIHGTVKIPKSSKNGQDKYSKS